MVSIPSFTGVEDASTFTQAIVDTVREPLVVLDHDLRVLAASRSFYVKFKVDRIEVERVRSGGGEVCGQV